MTTWQMLEQGLGTQDIKRLLFMQWLIKHGHYAR